MPAFAPGYSNSEAQLLMHFSALAYLDETPLPGESLELQEQRMKSDIDAALTSGPPYPAGWRVAWGPALTPDRANMLYIAGNGRLQQYAVVVRGTDWSFIVDWIEDFASLLPLVPYPQVGAGNIASGTLAGLLALQSLNFMSFLQGLPPNSSVYVTGHSLGGCLASVVAPAVARHFAGPGEVKVYTFAAPSPGDRSYQEYFNAFFGENEFAFRVFDTLDVVPDAWATLATIETYYQGYYLCPQDLKDIVNFGIRRVGAEYLNVGTDQPLTGQVIWPFGSERAEELDPIGDAIFLWQVAQQHSTLNYLSLLKVQPMTPDLAKVRATGAKLRLRRTTTA